MQRLVCAVILDDKCRFLILKRRLKWKGWEFVKGHIEGESMRKAILREIREEIGIKKAVIITRLPKDVTYSYFDGKEKIKVVQSGFIVKYSGGKIRISNEHSQYRWMDFKTAMKKLTHKSHLDFLKMANRHVKEMERKMRKA